MPYPELSPYHWNIYASVILSLPLFYIIGLFFIDRAPSASLSLGLRIAVGTLVTISGFATFFTSGNTGLAFLLTLFLLMGVSRRFRIDFSDVIELGAGKLLLLAAAIIIGLTSEGFRANLIEGETVYVGNTDVGHYAAYGFSLFENGIETNPEKITPEGKPTTYHFGDLWLNGIYSFIMGVLPYYAHIVVVRWLLIVVIGLMVYGWSRFLKASRLLSALAVFIFFFAVYLEFFNFPFPNTSLFNLFTFYYPTYCDSAQMIVALGFLPFWYLRRSGSVMFGTIGIWFLPFLNAGIMTIPVIAGPLLFGSFLFEGLVAGSISSKALKKQAILLLMSVVPLVYFKLTGRMLPTEGLELNWNQVYITAHTFARSVISEVFILPFLIGLVFFAQHKKMGLNETLVISVSLLLGALVSIAVIYPMIQGNSNKILLTHFGAMLVPVCTLGLVGLSLGQNRLLRILGYTSLMLISAQAIRLIYNTKGYEMVFDWSEYVEDHKIKSTIKFAEYRLLREHVIGEQVGYFMYNSEEKYDRVNYSFFTPLKGVLPGTVFYRLNSTPEDTAISAEQLNYFKLSTLGYFTYLHSFDSAKTTNSMLEYLSPQVIIEPKQGDFIYPESLSHVYSDTIFTDSYVLHTK